MNSAHPEALEGRPEILFQPADETFKAEMGRRGEQMKNRTTCSRRSLTPVFPRKPVADEADEP